jgi:TetR/AcrR family transcriptional regulator
MWIKLEEVLKEGIASGELIPVDPAQMRYAALGANIFYFLSAPLTRLAFGADPLERSALERRRNAVVEYLGQTIFIDREHGARVAERVLAAMPMPPLKRIRKRK